jgi:excisionase family DNA binding protein
MTAICDAASTDYVRVVDVKEARKRLGNCGKTKIYEQIALGKLRSVKFGRRTLIEVGSINALIDEMLSQSR